MGHHGGMAAPRLNDDAPADRVNQDTTMHHIHTNIYCLYDDRATTVAADDLIILTSDH